MGTMIWKKVRNSPAPSMRAASRSSLGALKKAWRIMKTEETDTILGTMRARWVLVRPTAEKMTNRGMMVSWEGTII